MNHVFWKLHIWTALFHERMIISYTDNFARVFVLKIFKMKQSVNKASKNEYQSKQNHRIFFKPNDHWHDNNQNQIDEDDS